MRIALLAPPYLSVPPVAYGGTEKIVSLLADGLVDAGHEVTLFATGDSLTRAKLSSIFPQGLGNSGLKKDDALMPLLHSLECYKRQKEFDIIHNHAQYLALFMADFLTTPVVHTIHGSFYPGELPQEKRMVLARFKHHNFVSISDNQRGGMPDLNYVSTVYNGLDPEEYHYVEKPEGDYLLWVGRIVEKKGPGTAIDVAQKMGIPLVIAAAIDPVDMPYFESAVKPRIDGKKVSYVGEMTQKTLDRLYGNALCTLFPITWHEPFGLVMIESMICGTPVVAYDIGSVTEIITHGKTGFTVPIGSGVEGLIHAVKEVRQIQRGDCRDEVKKRFTKEVMVEGYERVYEKLLGIG